MTFECFAVTIESINFREQIFSLTLELLAISSLLMFNDRLIHEPINYRNKVDLGLISNLIPLEQESVASCDHRKL